MPAPIKGVKIGTKYKKQGQMWSLGYHTGIDYPCAVGTPVFATAGGKVDRAGVDKSFGNYIRIVTADKVACYYAHLSKISVKVGQKVATGAQIGLSGNTGNSSGPHLHYEERVLAFKFGQDREPIYHTLLAPAPKDPDKAEKLKAEKATKAVTLGADAPAQISTGSTIDKVLAAAKALVDANYREGANNDTIMGKWFGLNHQPWCAMYVSWCFKEANASKLVAAQTPKGFASCQVGMEWFAKKNQLVPTKDAQPGDIVFFQFDDDAQADHVGLVLRNDMKKGIMYCYEGNTSGDGVKGSQSNGDGAFLKKRAYSLIMAVARPNYPKS